MFFRFLKLYSFSFIFILCLDIFLHLHRPMLFLGINITSLYLLYIGSFFVVDLSCFFFTIKNINLKISKMIVISLLKNTFYRHAYGGGEGGYSNIFIYIYGGPGHFFGSKF